MGLIDLYDKKKFGKIVQSEDKVAILQKLLKFKTVDELSQVLKIDRGKVAKEVGELVGYSLVIAIDKDKGTYDLTNIGVVLVCVLTGHKDLAEEFANHAIDAHAVRQALAS